MKKLFIEFTVLVFLFFGLYFCLNKFDWISITNYKYYHEKAEEKLGELTLEYLIDTNSEIETEAIVQPLDSLVNHLTQKNNIKNVKLHVIDDANVNAFALPGNHIILNSGLLLDAKNQNEILGVIAHELAHLYHNHTTQKLSTELGLTILIANNNELAANAIKKITSTSFDRKNEKQADLTALKFLEKANISQQEFVDFMERLSQSDSENYLHINWLETHPEGKTRVAYLTNSIKDTNKNYQNVIHENTFRIMQESLKY